MCRLKKVLRKVCALLVLFLFGSVLSVSAEEQGLPFSVEPVLPDNQVEGVKSYLSVKVDDTSLSETYSFLITNQSEVEQSVDVAVVDAYTSPNGGIQYALDGELERSSIHNDAYVLSNHVSIDQEVVTLAPLETKTIHLQVDLSDVKGSILGGLRFSLIDSETEPESQGGGFQINNKINMIIGAMFTFDTDTPIDYEFGEMSIDPMPSYFAMRLPISLNAPRLNNDVNLSYEVFNHLDEPALFSGEQVLNFAPHTSTDISLPFNYAEIESNHEYTLKGTLSYKDGDKSFDLPFERTFRYIVGENQDAVESDPLLVPKVVGTGTNHYLWYVIALVVVIFGVYKLVKHLRNR